jgi:hypothetical protein
MRVIALIRQYLGLGLTDIAYIGAAAVSAVVLLPLAFEEQHGRRILRIRAFTPIVPNTVNRFLMPSMVFSFVDEGDIPCF